MNEDAIKQLQSERDEAVLDKKVLDGLYSEQLHHIFQLRKVTMRLQEEVKELKARLSS